MPRLYQQKIGKGNTWYCEMQFRGHPQADKRGRLRLPLDTDKGLAIKALDRLIEQRNASRFGRAPKDTTYQELKERVLRHASGKAKNTHEQYKRAFKELEAFRPVLSAAQITPDLLMELYTHWKTREKPRGLYVRNRDIQSLKAAMRLAEDWGMISKGHNWTAVKRDKEPTGRLLWYTVDNLKSLFARCHGVWETIARLGARAGLRRSEIYWLAWEDVDFERERIHVAPNPQWVPKDHERRWVPMTVDLKFYLKKLPKAGKWVIEDEGVRPTPGSMTIYFKRLSRQAGLKGNIHTLRHTYGSHLASAGVSPYIIQKLMGHSKVEMTQRYMHLAPDAHQAAAKALPALAHTDTHTSDEKTLPR